MSGREMSTDRDSRTECDQRDTSLAAGSTGLLTIDDLTADEEFGAIISAINTAMDEFVQNLYGEPASLYEAARHLLVAGGKRLRSLIVLLATQAVGGDIEDALPFAVAMELVQTASLLHDDVIDDDVLRRGVETAHRKFGTRIAILAGDLLVAEAMSLIGERATPELLAMIGKAGIMLCEGEASDLLMEITDSESVSVRRYLAMAERKTASLLRVAAGVGAVVGGGTTEQRDALMEYARKIGLAFQIRDDVLNLTSTPDVTGKSVLSDLKWKTSNYVVIHCLEHCSQPVREECLRALGSNSYEDVLRVLEESGSIAHANEVAWRLAREAKAVLRGADLQKKHLLERLADFVVLRAH